MKRSSITVIVIVSFLSTVALFSLLVVGWLQTFRTTKGFAATPRDLQSADLPRFFIEVLPPGARDIRYWCEARAPYVDAVFSLSEAEFLEWAARQQWPIKPIKGPTLNLAPVIRETGDEAQRERDTVLEDGYSYSNDDVARTKPGWSVSVKYSKKSNKVYLTVGYNQ